MQHDECSRIEILESLHPLCLFMYITVLRLLTLLSLVLAGVHISQSDVGIAQALDPSDHLAPLFPDHINDLQGHV